MADFLDWDAQQEVTVPQVGQQLEAVRVPFTGLSWEMIEALQARSPCGAGETRAEPLLHVTGPMSLPGVVAYRGVRPTEGSGHGLWRRGWDPIFRCGLLWCNRRLRTWLLENLKLCRSGAPIIVQPPGSFCKCVRSGLRHVHIKFRTVVQEKLRATADAAPIACFGIAFYQPLIGACSGIHAELTICQYLVAASVVNLTKNAHENPEKGLGHAHPGNIPADHHTIGILSMPLQTQE